MPLPFPSRIAAYSSAYPPLSIHLIPTVRQSREQRKAARGEGWTAPLLRLWLNRVDLTGVEEYGRRGGGAELGRYRL